MLIMQKKYSPSFIISLALHVALFFFLFTSFAFNSSLPYVVKPGTDQQIVQGVAVDSTQVQQEVSQLHAQQIAQEKAQTNHIQQLQTLADQAKAERAKELANLQQLKTQQQAAQQQAQQKLAALQQQQTAREQQLAQLQKQQQTATQNYQAQQQKLAALQQKQQQMSQQSQQSQDAKDLIQQQLQQEQGQLDQAKAQYIQGIVNKYNALVTQAIYQNWFIPPNTDPKLSVKLQVDVAQSGAVSDVTVLQSSGNSALDQSATTAVYKSSPLPIPMNNPDVFKQFQQFSITMTPSETSTLG